MKHAIHAHRHLFSIATCLLTAGCSNVVPITAHPLSNPADVRVYQIIPNPKYEELGIISVPVAGPIRWDAKGDADAAGFAQAIYVHHED